VKTGCENRELSKPGLPRRPVRKASPIPDVGFRKFKPIRVTGVRKSKTSRWRALALACVNLFMVAHVIQWWIAGKTISPIEPS